MKRSVFFLLLMLLPIMSVFSESSEAKPTKLVLGAVPSREANRMITSMEGLAELLSIELELPVEAYVATSFNGLIEAMGTGKVDIGIFGPSALVMAEERHNVEIILASIRNGNTSYRAQINVRSDSGINSLDDLKGKTIAFVDPASASGFHFPYVYLLEQGIEPEKDLNYVFSGSHDSGILGVIHGDFAAAITYEDARNDLIDEFPDVFELVEPLAWSDAIPNDGVAVRAGLPKELVTRIQDTFIAIGESKPGKDLLMELYYVTGFEPANGDQYDVVRRTSKIIEERF